ncbi:MAG: serine hydrolase [Chitinophagaceae bacterium]|nr:serine hydrolase [Chitinophagaceae bacterium]
MKKIFISFFCCMSVLSGFGQTVQQKLEEFLTIYNRDNLFNGSVLVAQKENILLQKGYGWKNIHDSSLNDANTIFQIGSVTKQFTAAIILQLQEQKKLSIEDSVSKYFQGFPHGGKITVRHLVTHTSGLYNYTKDTVFMKNDAVKFITRDKMLSLFRDKPLDFEPGSSFSYSNSGYVLLGYIIEQVTGKSYFRVVRENIFKPLRMDHSGFNFASLNDTDKATGYFLLTPKANMPAPVVDSSVAHAAGAIYTTVGDLYKWDRALYNGKLINDASMQVAFTPNKGNYAYGWVIDSAWNKKVAYHTGGIFGFSSIIARVLDDQTCIILFDNHGSPSLEKMAEGLNAIVQGKPYELPKSRPEIELSAEILRQYIGEYELAPNFILTVTFEEGQLMTQATGQAKVPIFAEKENFFFLKVVDAQLEFIKGVDGKMEKLILHQKGQTIPAKKLGK